MHLDEIAPYLSRPLA